MNTAEENRKKYPEIAAAVDKVREHFPNAKVRAIRPHGYFTSQATHEADDLDVVEYD